MLVVLDGAPVASPLETVLDEKAVTKIVLRNPIGKLLRTVDIGLACSGLDKYGTVFLPADTGVIERVDIDSKTTSMVREFRAALHYPVAIAGSIVGTHRPLIVIAILGDGTDALNGVFRLIEFSENLL